LFSFIRHIILAFILVAFLWPGPSYALSIDQIRFGEHPDKTRMVLELSGAAEYRVFILSDPYRIVIDLPHFDWRAGTVYKPASTGITAVRQGKLEPGISRVVFDMDRPVSVQSAFFLPSQSGKPDRLVVDFKTVSVGAFQNSAHKILGRLNVGNTNTQAAPRPYKTASASGMVPPPGKTASRKATQKPLIVIDAGHGGNDPGAIGKGKTHEKNIVLSLARELKSQLEATGRYRVMLTRNNDQYIRLRERVNFARKHQADLFISLHADSIQNSKVRGTSIYTLSEKASDAQTAKLAARENRSDLIAGLDLSHEDEDVANILVDLAMRDTMNQSNFFANILVDKMRGHGVRTLENPHRFAGFAVLKAPDIPSILIEAGFISNPAEEKQLSRTDHRKKLASSIRNGITAYFDHVRKNERM